MPGPKLPEYPKPMFKADEGPVHARNAKHEDELAAQGWITTYIPRDFPRMMYHPTEKRFLTVQSESEKNSAVKEGWLLKPLEFHFGESDPGIPNAPLPGAEADSQMAKLQEQLAEQQKLINSLLLENSSKREKHKREGAD